MSIVMASFAVTLHSLSLETLDDLESLRCALQKAVEAVHPGMSNERDVEVEFMVSSGNTSGDSAHGAADAPRFELYADGYVIGPGASGGDS